MNFNDYQQLAKRTDGIKAGKDDTETMLNGLLNAAMGMTGEAAETLEHMKKVLFQGHKLDVDKLIEEASDCMWYIAKLARYCGVTMEELAQRNIDKLRKRYPAGFEVERSVNREL